MKSARYVSFVLALLGLLVFGCKKTPEEAMASWQKNEEAIQKSEAKYPAFKPALDDLLASAKKDFDAAKPDADPFETQLETPSVPPGLTFSMSPQVGGVAFSLQGGF